MANAADNNEWANILRAVALNSTVLCEDKLVESLTANIPEEKQG